MARHQVTCIRKRDHDDPWERITHLGGPGFGIKTTEEVIADIKDGNPYFTHVGEHTVDIAIRARNGKEYVATEPDGDKPDNLLALPECDTDKNRGHIGKENHHRYAATCPLV